jgi:hypothetical protein
VTLSWWRKMTHHHFIGQQLSSQRPIQGKTIGFELSQLEPPREHLNVPLQKFTLYRVQVVNNVSSSGVAVCIHKDQFVAAMLEIFCVFLCLLSITRPLHNLAWLHRLLHFATVFECSRTVWHHLSVLTPCAHQYISSLLLARDQCWSMSHSVAKCRTKGSSFSVIKCSSPWTKFK